MDIATALHILYMFFVFYFKYLLYTCEKAKLNSILFQKLHPHLYNYYLPFILLFTLISKPYNTTNNSIHAFVPTFTKCHKHLKMSDFFALFQNMYTDFEVEQKERKCMLVNHKTLIFFLAQKAFLFTPLSHLREVLREIGPILS